MSRKTKTEAVKLFVTAEGLARVIRDLDDNYGNSLGRLGEYADWGFQIRVRKPWGVKDGKTGDLILILPGEQVDMLMAMQPAKTIHTIYGSNNVT